MKEKLYVDLDDEFHGFKCCCVVCFCISLLPLGRIAAFSKA